MTRLPAARASSSTREAHALYSESMSESGGAMILTFPTGWAWYWSEHAQVGQGDASWSHSGGQEGNDRVSNAEILTSRSASSHRSHGCGREVDHGADSADPYLAVVKVMGRLG